MTRLFSRWYVWAGLIVAGVVLIGVILNLLPTINDPTEGVFSVKVVNSLGRRVGVGMCDDKACRSTVDRTTLSDGEGFDLNVSVATPIPLRVTAVDGSLFGCWVLSVPRRTPHERVAMTSISPCPGE